MKYRLHQLRGSIDGYLEHLRDLVWVGTRIGRAVLVFALLWAITQPAISQDTEIERLGYQPLDFGTNSSGPLVLAEGVVFIRHNTFPWRTGIVGWKRSGAGWDLTPGMRYYAQTPISTPFASAMEMDGGRLFVGSPQADVYGRVHVVEKSGGSFPTFIDGSTTVPSPFGATLTSWGHELGVSGPWLAVGAPLVNGPVFVDTGRIVMFRESQGQYGLHSILLPPAQAVVDDSLYFGVRFALSGNTLAATGHSQLGSSLGQVFLYEYDSVLDEWQHQQTIVDPLGPIASEFGYGLGLSGDTLVIGHARKDLSFVASGVAHLYERDSAGTWQPRVVLQASNPAVNIDGGNAFGRSLDVQGDLVAVGAVRAKGSTDTIGDGSVYVFRRRSDGTWPATEDLRYVTDTPGVPGLGYRVVIDKGVVAASSSPWTYPDGTKISVYLYAPGVGETVCDGAPTTSGALAELKVTNMDLGHPEFVLSGAEPDTSYILLASASVVAPGPGLCLGGPVVRAGYGQVNSYGETVWSDGFVERVANAGQWTESVFFQVWTRSQTGEIAFSNAVEARQ